MSLSKFIKKLAMVNGLSGSSKTKIAGVNDKDSYVVSTEVVWDSAAKTITFTNESSLPSWLEIGKFFRTYDGTQKTTPSSSDVSYIPNVIITPNALTNNGVLFQVLSISGNVITVDDSGDGSTPVDRDTTGAPTNITLDGRIAIAVNNSDICRINGVGATVYNAENQNPTAVTGDGSGVAAAFADHYHVKTGVTSFGTYIATYVDTSLTDISTVIGAPYAPDGTDVVQGDRVLFTNTTDLTGSSGRGVYEANVDGGGNLTSWTKQTFGQDPNGDSVDGDQVYLQAGTTYADHTFRCTDTINATWVDLGTSITLTVQEDGTPVGLDTNNINFSSNFSVTNGAGGSNDVNVDIFEAERTQSIYVDGNRSDTYTEVGTIEKPYKTIQGAIDAIAALATPTVHNAVIIQTGEYLENVVVESNNIGFLTIKGNGNVVIMPAAGNALQSTSNNDGLIAFNVENITFQRPVVITGSDGTTGLQSLYWENISCTSNSSITATCVNGFTIRDLYSERPMTLNNVNFFALENGRQQSTIDITMDSTADTPSWGSSGEFLLNGSYTTGAVTYTIGGTATYTMAPMQSRLGDNVATTVPAGVTILAYSSFIRGTQTNAGTIILKNSFVEGYTDNGGTLNINNNPSSQVYYDNSTSDLTEENVQDAIDELCYSFYDDFIGVSRAEWQADEIDGTSTYIERTGGWIRDTANGSSANGISYNFGNYRCYDPDLFPTFSTNVVLSAGIDGRFEIGLYSYADSSYIKISYDTAIAAEWQLRAYDGVTEVTLSSTIPLTGGIDKFDVRWKDSDNLMLYHNDTYMGDLDISTLSFGDNMEPFRKLVSDTGAPTLVDIDFLKIWQKRV
jgi:hypothetical protein